MALGISAARCMAFIVTGVLGRKIPTHAIFLSSIGLSNALGLQQVDIAVMF